MPSSDIWDQEEHAYADNNGVKIHYAALGSGPLVVMIHGFPDFWYTWRHQMAALSSSYRVAALDLRGYNESDKPQDGEQYAMRHLVGDVAAVVQHAGYKQAVIVGHDWGGAIAWQVATHLPQITERLIVLNLPHPRGLARELAHNPLQQASSQYAREFQQEGTHAKLTPEWLSRWVTDAAARERYLEAFKRSDTAAMMQYYKQNYPREPYTEPTGPVTKVAASTLLIHGLRDTALLASGLNDTWEWVARDLTIATIPDAGHFVQQDAAPLVTRTILSWLGRDAHAVSGEQKD